jgi:hypothetical protein
MLLQGNGFLDAINTVETVSMDAMLPGSVSITVTATAVFSQVRPGRGIPQPYARSPPPIHTSRSPPAL